MGLNTGSITLSQYRVIGIKNASLAKLNSVLPRFQAKKIKLTGLKSPEKVGWVMPRCPETEDLDEYGVWDMSHCRTDDGFLLRMRIEKRAVPAELLRLVFMNKVADMEGRSGKSVGRAEKRELKDTLAEELIEQALPAISYIDALWEEETGRLLLFSGGKRIRELFEDLFRKTFSEPLGATLTRVDPPLLGLTLEEWAKPKAASDSISRISKTVPINLSIGLQ